MQIFIITPAGKTITVDIDADETIQDLKTQIEASEGTPLDKQSLVFAGKVIQDDQKLSDCNIGEEATLYLAIQVKGGFFAIAAGILGVLGIGSIVGIGSWYFTQNHVEYGVITEEQ